MNYSKDFVRGWLSGLWDGEGSVIIRSHTNGKKHTTYYLTVTNTEPSIIQVCKQFLTNLEIKFTEWKPRQRKAHHKMIYTLHVGQAESIQKFRQLIPLFSSHKQATLNQINNWVNRPKITKYNPEKIVELYSKGMSFRQIAKFYNLQPGSHSMIRNIALQAGIRGRKKWAKL